MTCEILCVGTELLLGDVVNTNAAYIAKNLAGMGVHVYYQSVVGDNPERLKLALETAFAHADCVITTGGLGPTKDDLTKETACAALGVKLELHQPSYEHLAEILKQSGRQMTESQKKQAYLPEGCTVLHNTKGTAPGFAITKDNKTLIMLPGPPREMTAMFEGGVRPYLTKSDAKELYSRRVRVMEIGESDCADALSDLLDGQNPTVATYAKDVETEIRITASAEDEADAERIMRNAEAQFAGKPGQVMFVVKDGSETDKSRFVPISSDSDGDWAELHTQATNDIVVAHSWFRSLSGLDYSTGFNSERILHEYEIALNTVILAEQAEILEPMRELFETVLGIDASSLEFVNRPPTRSKPIYMRVWEARKADGLDYDPQDESQQCFLSEISKYNVTKIG
jgi:molybdenum cofactor synthesis domain-containing protein